LHEGTYARPNKITWDEFRDRFDDEYLSSKAEKTQSMASTVFALVERIIPCQRLLDLNEQRLAYFVNQLRNENIGTDEKPKHRRPATIETYMVHLMASLNWAVRVKLLREAPDVVMPKLPDDDEEMKGRPITGEEYDRMIAAIGKTLKSRNYPEVKPQVMESWNYLLEGLWLSGLRLGEAMNLSWDDDSKITVQCDGRRPLLHFSAKSNKRRKTIRCPMTPDFWEFLSTTPEDQRTGNVFAPLGIRGKAVRAPTWISRVIGRFGQNAGIKVKEDDETDYLKFASAHDLRRSFGERWAPRIMPKVLKELMRHKRIDTTMKYYVGQNAEATADVVWDAYSQLQEVGTFVGSSDISADPSTC